MSDSFRDASRLNWIPAGGFKPTDTQLGVGCLQRIADATELMAREHARLVRERDNYERWYREQSDRARRLERRNSALRGVITRLKARKP